MWRSSILVAAGVMVISGLALGLYQSLFFRFVTFYDIHATLAGLVFSTFYVAYFLLAVPASLFHRQFGYKLGFLLGLTAFAVGSFILYLAILRHNIGIFLASMAMMGCSGALLDTSLNPLAVEAGKPSTSVIRLNVVQVFYGLGLFAGYFFAVVLFDEHFELSLDVATPHSARPYLLAGLAAILLAFFVEHVTLPSFIRKNGTSALRQEFKALVDDNAFRIAAASVFSCCAALMVLWTTHYRYHVDELPGHVVTLFERGWIWFLLGRLVGCGLMRWIAPLRLLRWSVVFSVVAILAAAIVGGGVGWVCLLFVSASIAILYPTVIGDALDRHRTHIKLAAGLLVTAGGLGSALFAIATSLAVDVLLVPPRIVVCFVLPFLVVVLLHARSAGAGRERLG